MSMMGWLKKAEAEAEKAEGVAQRIHGIISNGRQALEEHHDGLKDRMDGVLAFVKDLVSDGEEAAQGIDRALGSDGSSKSSLGGVLDTFDHIDAGKMATAISTVTNVAEDVVKAATTTYLGSAGGGIAIALASAAEAAAKVGVPSSLASDVAGIVQDVAHVLKDKPADADPLPVAAAAKAHIDATDQGDDAHAAAVQAAQAAGADEATAEQIAAAVSTAP